MLQSEIFLCFKRLFISGLFFFYIICISAQSAPGLILSGNNANIFIRDYKISGFNSHIIAGDFASDTLFLNGAAVFMNKGYKDQGVQQADGYFLETDSLGNIIYKLQLWCQGKIPDSTAASADGAVKIFGAAGYENGDLLLSGFFSSDTLHFGNDNLPWQGKNSFFLIKIDRQGKTIWKKTVALKDNLGSGSIKAMLPDTDGSSLIAGEYFGEMQMDTLTMGCINCSVHDLNVFILKVSAAGVPMWGKRIGGNDFDYINGLSKDSYGHYIITGTFSSNSLPMGKDTLTDIAGSKGGTNMYTACLDNTGDVLWARQTINGNNEQGISIAADQDGNIYAMGNYDGTKLYLDDTVLSNKASSWNFFVVKYNQAGQVRWAKTFDGDYAQFGKSLLFNRGNLLLAGSFESASLIIGNDSLLNKGKSDIFIADMTTEGRMVSAESFGSDDDEIPLFITCENTGATKYIAGAYKSADLKIEDNQFMNNRSGFRYQNVFIAPLKKLHSSEELPGSIKEDLHIYPNPFSDVVKLDLHYQSATKGIVKVYDVYGRCVLQQPLHPGAGHSIFNLDTTGIPEGIYLFEYADCNHFRIENKLLKCK